MFTSCLHHVYIMFTSCLHHVYIMFTSCVHHVYIMFTSCLHHVYIMFTSCLHHVYIMFTSCLHHVYIMFTSFKTTYFCLCSKKRRSSIDLTENRCLKKVKIEPFKCVLCGKYLTPNDHPGAVNHFATHTWIDKQSTKQATTNPAVMLKHFMHKLPLDAWFVHHGLLSDNPAAKNIR
jgi:hypothetical protein